jgi:urease accessory protein UreF
MVETVRETKEGKNARMAQQQMWQIWIEAVYNASNGKINHWKPLLDEKAAEVEHPNLYNAYRSGMSPEEFVNQHLVHYDDLEAGELAGTIAQIDPDDEDIPDEEY